jgi:hypothetical protein
MERFGHAGNGEFLSLGTRLAKHRHKSATDPRDVVYSLVGVTSNVTLQNSIVDYHLATSQIYRGIAICWNYKFMI